MPTTSLIGMHASNCDKFTDPYGVGLDAFRRDDEQHRSLQHFGSTLFGLAQHGLDLRQAVLDGLDVELDAGQTIALRPCRSSMLITS